MDQSHKSIFSDESLTPPKPHILRSPHPAPTPVADPQSKRKFDIHYLDRSGHLCEQTLLAATHPAFEQAFCVLKQGCLLQTDHGPVTVEEILPGDRVRMGDGSTEVVQWRGSTTISPFDLPANAPSLVMTRITADALGYNRPSPDLVLGHGARILHRAPGIRRVGGTDAAFIPAADFVDGNHLLSLRATSPVTMYQFGFHGQRCLSVNGVPIETLHPGTAFNLGLRGDSLRAYLALFPHKSSFEDFGLLHVPRLRLRDLELLV